MTTGPVTGEASNACEAGECAIYATRSVAGHRLCTQHAQEFNRFLQYAKWLREARK